MKDLKGFINEQKKEYNCNYNEDDLKCLLGALAFVKVSNNENKLCEELNINKNVFNELYEDLFQIVDDSSKVNDIVVKLSNK